MNGIIIFASLLVSVYGQLNPSGCGLRPLAPTTDKVVGGTVAIPGDWGW